MKKSQDTTYKVDHKIWDFFRFTGYFCTNKKLMVQNVPLYLQSSAQETDISVEHKALFVGMCALLFEM